MLEVFDHDSIRRILRVRRRDCVPSVKLRRRLCLTSKPALLVQRRLHWFGHAARRLESELMKDFLYPHRLARGSGELEGHARWRKDWVKVSSELAQDRPRRGQLNWSLSNGRHAGAGK